MKTVKKRASRSLRRWAGRRCLCVIVLLPLLAVVLLVILQAAGSHSSGNRSRILSHNWGSAGKTDPLDALNPADVPDHFFRESARRQPYPNPYCSLRQEYKYMAWSPMDVRKATVDYFRENVQLVIITGNYDNYSRVEAARCTWLAHVPQENILFATDRLHVPGSGWGADGPHDIYRFGNWHANEDTEASGAGSGRRRALDAEQFQQTVKTWGHPVAWVTAQMRFFDGLRFAYEDQRKAWASMTDKSRFKHSRWIALLDDDSYVHLDAMAAVFTYHEVRGLLLSDEHWWREVWSLRYAADVVTNPGDRNWHAFLRYRRELDWSVRCRLMQARNEEEQNEFLQLSPFQEECLRLPKRLSELFLLFLEARGTESPKEVTRMLWNGQPRRKIIDEFARTVANGIFFLDDGSRRDSTGSRQLFWTLWTSMHELLAPTWVQLYLLPPLRLPDNTLAGEGSYFNAAGFYRHYMKERKLPNGHVSYAYETYCLPYLLAGHASDGTIQVCAKDVGSGQLVEERFFDRSLITYIEDGTVSPTLPVTEKGANLTADQLQQVASDKFFVWATGHAKMEFYDTMRHRTGPEKGMTAPSHEELHALYRLAHFRMRLYYESVYQHNKLSMLMFKQLGAPVRNELMETNESRQRARENYEKIFLPALHAGKI